jgi:hypothetical protein
MEPDRRTQPRNQRFPPSHSVWLHERVTPHDYNSDRHRPLCPRFRAAPPQNPHSDPLTDENQKPRSSSQERGTRLQIEPAPYRRLNNGSLTQGRCTNVAIGTEPRRHCSDWLRDPICRRWVDRFMLPHIEELVAMKSCPRGEAYMRVQRPTSRPPVSFKFCIAS